jgi:RimJ/RimL family protein N-acetyltransferase
VPIGISGYLRINPEDGSIEVGHLHFSKLLQKTPAATEAMYLMMQYAFDNLKYRRYEWKCDSLNQPSRDAALRLGFKFEGIFRQHMVRKDRNRDTAWFSIIDSEWPSLKEKFQKWLQPNNFDDHGYQRISLRDI